jgi:hypothetical protein
VEYKLRWDDGSQRSFVKGILVYPSDTCRPPPPEQACSLRNEFFTECVLYGMVLYGMSTVSIT